MTTSIKQNVIIWILTFLLTCIFFVNHSQAAEIVLKNGLGSQTEIENSEIGPNGSVYNGPLMYSPGKFGNGFTSKSGAGKSGVNFGLWENINPDYDQAGTIEFWWKAPRDYDAPATAPDEIFASGIFSDMPLSFQLLYRWRENNGLGGFDFQLWDDSNQLAAQRFLYTGKVAPFKAGDWVHVAFVWDINGLPEHPDVWYGVYVDGQYYPLVDSLDPGASINVKMNKPSNSYFAMGYYDADFNNQQNGVIDNVVIWDQAIVPKPNSVPAGAKLAVLGDINGDGSEDVAVLVHDTAAGTVTATVMDAEDDHLIQQISFNPDRKPVAFEVMPDIDGNGAPELVVLGEGLVVAEIRDSLSGALQNTVTFNSTRAPIDLAILADQNGNGIPELAVLARSSVSGAVSVVVKDALTNQYLNYVGFSSNFTPLELAVIADLNGNARVEFAVLGVEATTAGHDKVEIRDSVTDAVLNNVFYSPTIQAKRLAILPDQNSNVAEELVVLRQGRYVIVQINDAHTDSLVNHLGVNPSFKYSQVLVIPDLNGNGVPEIGVLGTDPTANQTRVEITDAKTAAKISVVFFDNDFKPQGDVAVVDDINGNGSAELAYLGQRDSDDKLKVIIRDSLTKAVINTVDF